MLDRLFDRRHNTGMLGRALLLSAILLFALFLRVRDLLGTPLGVHYDEAANVILSQEIAAGARPLFIKAYTGKEVLYFYLAAGMIQLIGHPLFAVRLASALIGVVSVAITYRAGRELFHHEPGRRGFWIAVVAAAIQAANLWAITVSRLGFRALAQPPFQALTFLFIFRGLRYHRAGPLARYAYLQWIWAGLFCGLAAYTYLAVRAFPILLLLFAAWVIAFYADRLERLGGLWLLALVASAVFAPLGAFYLREPEFFATRMGQVSVFSERVGGDAPWQTLWHAAKVAFGMFTYRGDLNWRFNVAGASALWWPLGMAFYAGLLIGLWRLSRGPDHRRRSTYFLLLLWLPVMLLPAILGGGDVEVSLSLRAVGVMPALFYWPALGLVEGAPALRGVLGRLQVARWWPVALRWISVVLVAAVLLGTGFQVYDQIFHVWGPSTPGYYVSSGDLVEVAELLNERLPPDARAYISAEHYRHPTLALLAERYAEIKWLVGPNVFVFPTPGQGETWYVFTSEAMPPEPFLRGFLGPPDEMHPAPDGEPAFLLYRFPPGQMPRPDPQIPGDANLGDRLHFLGYDLNAEPVSGEDLDVTLYFEALEEVERDDFTFFVHLVDERDFQWGGETFFTYPSTQWAAGERMAFRRVFPIWPGAPPGSYHLSVGAFSPSLDARLPVLNRAGQMAGTTVEVGPLVLERAAAPPSDLPPIQQPLHASFEPGLKLLGFDRDRGDLRPGETLALSLYWQSEAPIDEGYTVALWLEHEQERLSLWRGAPAQGRYPFDQWGTPEFVRDRCALRLPTDAPAGDYELRLALLRPDGTPLPNADGAEWISLSTLHVQATDRRWEPPDYAYPVGARLGDAVELLGYDLDRQQAAPGGTVHLTLVWRCLREVDVAYTVFTHLLDPGGQVRGQQDNPPVNGTYPTTLWLPGEIVVDEYNLTVHADAPAGRYVIEVGMYEPSNMQRLPVPDPTGGADDRILLGRVEIQRP